MSAETDEALVARARSGQGDDAFDELVVRHRENVYGLALKLVGNSWDAEEVLQEAFLQAYQKLDTFRGESKFSTWLYRIAANFALMRLRSKQRRPTQSLDEFLPKFDEMGRWARPDLDYGKAAEADEMMDREELAKRIRDALDQLPEMYRTVIVLRDMQGSTTEETAKILGIEPEAVRTRLHRARLLMRGFLGHLVGAEKK